ncbi:hypothetical protein NJ76_28430 [Rhodococcus sp. IITR03]|nr:hypothetical protein NJ76_28430 [Rhodococcus sp. IITR03]
MPRCRSIVRYRDTIMRTVTDLPVADHPFPLRVRISCYRGENSSYEREVLDAQHRRLARPGLSTIRRSRDIWCDV